MNITLKHNKGFKWYKNDSFYLKGYFYIDAVFYEKENALNFLLTIKDTSDFKELLKNINGIFTIVFSDKKTVCIASDITRSFPIFYTFQNEKLFLSDDIIYLKNTFNILDFNAVSEIELKASCHTHGNKTLLQNVNQIQASEYLIIQNHKIIESNFFFSYAIEKAYLDSYSILKNKIVIAFENSFKRFIDSLNNRTAVIPLSGGFDSRLIAVMLKKHNYKNVVCYTYGRKDSFEIENSKKTAETLNFDWYFIEYKNELISNYLPTEEFKNYAHFAGKLSSMPYLQEYFAIKFLKDKKIITQDAIFVPGFAGDILGGSEYSKTISKNLKHSNLPEVILEKKMINYCFSNDEKKQIEAEIKKNLFLFDKNYTKKIPETVLEDYNLKERIAKYIFNSASYYTFFGHQFRFPFWDTELLSLFKKIPIKYKKAKLLFDDILINDYFKPFDVYFEKEIQPTKKQIKLQKLKDKIKPHLPNQLKKRILKKHDWNNYKPITDQMVNELNKKNIKAKKLYKDYNEIISQWYIHFSKKNI